MTIRNSLAAVIVLVVGVTLPAEAAARGRGQARSGRNHGAAARPVVVVRPTVITGRAMVTRPTVVARTRFGGTIIGGTIGRTVIGRPIAPRRGVQRVIIAPYRSYHRPYYTFRPRTRFSFGVVIGYPVAYPYYAYAKPYPAYSSYSAYPTYPTYPPAAAYPSAPPYPGYPQGSVRTYPAPPEVGGISLEFSPADAAIYVDGQYVGMVSSFGPSSAPLSLAPGRHHVELQAPNYIPLAFDVDVVAGEVIPYQGSLRPY